jgi:hypothetical protein
MVKLVGEKSTKGGPYGRNIEKSYACREQGYN